MAGMDVKNIIGTFAGSNSSWTSYNIVAATGKVEMIKYIRCYSTAANTATIIGIALSAITVTDKNVHLLSFSEQTNPLLTYEKSWLIDNTLGLKIWLWQADGTGLTANYQVIKSEVK